MQLASTRGNGVPCLLGFTGLEEFVVFMKPYFEYNNREAVRGRPPPSYGRRKAHVTVLMRNVRDIFAALDPKWKKPSVSVLQDRKSLGRTLE